MGAQPASAVRPRRRLFGFEPALKALNLPALLKAAAPFEVELTPSVIAHLRAQQLQVALKPRQIVTEISYAGDEGGIVCHMAPEDGRDALIVSLTLSTIKPGGTRLDGRSA